MDEFPDLTQLEAVAAEMAEEWGLELGSPFPGSRYSYVVPAGEDAVLKITPPDDDESDEEGDALALWAGDGAVRLLRRDTGRRALLIERALPGTDISGLPEDEATAIAVGVASHLWRPAREPFRWIGDHVGHWIDAAWASEPRHPLLPSARELFSALDVGRRTLVHGDLHHHNILASERGFLAIDAKAMLGEPEFDVPPFLWNPLSSTMQLDVVERRLAAFAGAGLDQFRMRAWAVIRGAYLDIDDIDVLQALIPSV
jgi:streptomycin 6-kinase